MKKKLLYSLLFCCLGMFMVACGDDHGDNNELFANQFGITVLCPSDAKAFSGEMSSEEYKFRCILEMYAQDGTQVCREEKIINFEELSEGLSFHTTAEPGMYDCLIWADYVKVSAEGYFDASDLKNVTVNDVNCLINNEASEAFYFCGEFQKESGKAVSEKVLLCRPFTRISVREDNLQEFGRLKKIAVSFDAFAVFNVATGKVKETKQTVAWKDENFQPMMSGNGMLFTAYVFSNEQGQTLGEITMQLENDQQTEQTVVIPAIIPLAQGKQMLVSNSMLNQSDADYRLTFECDIDDWTTNDVIVDATPVQAQVGDYFYADGTYSSVYIKDEKNPCIGVVFAVAYGDGEASVDGAENYVSADGIQKLHSVHGWVVGLREFSNTRAASVSVLDVTKLPVAGLGQGKLDINGFQNTESFKKKGIDLEEWPIAKLVIEYEADEHTKAPDNTSGWYWGAVQQYMTLAKSYASVTVENRVVTHVQLHAVGQAMEFLAAEGVADKLGVGGNFNWSNSVEATTGKLFRVGLLTSDQYFGQTAGWDPSSNRSFRPILTF